MRLIESRYFWLVLALITTTISVPMLQYQTVLYASQYNASFLDPDFIAKYIRAWWEKIVRRMTGQIGPAENVTINKEEAQTYTSPSTKTSITEPTSIYDVIALLRNDQEEYSAQILSYIEANNLPNKSAQIDLIIVPENIYLTLYWDKSQLTIYDGWIGDQNANEYITAVATSQLILDLYQNRNNTSQLWDIILEAEGNGELTYAIKRLNPPDLTLAILALQILSSALSIVGWTMVFTHRRGLSK